MNTQKKSPVLPRTEDSRVALHSVFYTIQGEGPFAGAPAVFVRLAGCNLQCVGCDTLYTVTEGSNLYSPVEVCSLVGNVLPPQQTGKPTLVVITGGEPLRQTNVGQLVIYLLVTNHLVQIETNGSLDLPEDLMYLYQKNSPLLERLTIVCSPKTSIVAPTLWNRCHYKFVLQKGRVDSYGLPTKVLDMGVDFTWMHDLIRNLPPGLNTYVQPYDEGSAEKNLEHIRVTVDSSLSFGHRVSLQLHKLLGLE